MANMNLVTGYAGAAHVTAGDDGSLNVAIFGSGQYVLNRGNRFSAQVISNNSIRISDGDIMLQGRHIRINEGNHVDLTIANGTQVANRNDLIVARYTRNTSTGVEACNLVVIQGTASSSPADPAYTTGDIITAHATQVDMPLYRVPIVGLNVQTLVPLFTVRNLPNSVNGKMADSNGNITLTAGSVGALPSAGGTLSGAISTNGIILKQGVDYGDNLPSTVTPGKLFFKRVT